MTLAEYAHVRYLPDLQVFRSHYPETIPYLEGDELARRCDALQIDSVLFISNTYLESLLLAAVCDHDYPHFHRYREKIEFERRLGAIGGLQGLRLPQKMLANLDWPDQQLAVLADGIKALVPQWAQTSGQVIGTAGDGIHIVAALLTDEDVYERPERVRQGFIDAIGRGMRAAADQLGID